MAGNARDLSFRFLSQTDRFDLAKPADSLNTLGDAARDARDDLERLERVDPNLDRTGAAARDAGDDLDRFGSNARDAARRVDAAMDAIARSSSRGATDVDRAARDGGESLRDMGEEGTGTARELAASFDGTADSIKDGMQEAATNVLATLGPLGAAAGVAAGIGIGFLRGQAEKLREEVSGITSALIDAANVRGGASSTILDQLRRFAEDGTISDLAADARAGRVDVNGFLRAMAGDPEALERTRSAIARQRTELLEAGRAGRITQEQLDAQDTRLGVVAAQLEDTAGKYALAEEAARAYADAVGVSSETLDAYTSAVEGFTDPAAAYTETLADKEAKERATAEATAAATKSQTDSWEDYAKDVEVSVGEYLDTLEEQVTAQEEWSTNLATLARRGVSEGVLAELSRMGPEGAPLVAALTDASDAELSRLVALYARKGSESTDQLEDAIRSGRPGVAGQVQEIRDDMRRRFSSPVAVPTTVTPPTNTARVLRDVQNGMRPVTIPVMLQNVPRSALSRYVP